MSLNENIVYLCEPKKNKECRKGTCQKLCFFTHEKKAKAGLLRHTKFFLKGVG